MSLLKWAKRSPANNGIILVTILAAIALNFYYRDKPTDALMATKSGDVAIAASPKVKAFLMTIRWAEGTASEDGYKTMYGGAKFDSFDDHPRRVQKTYYKDKNGIERTFNASDCSGAYQICSPVFDEYSQKLKTKDFSPKTQDAIAIQLIKDRGAFKFVEEGNIQKAVEIMCPEWASFPCSNKNDGYYPNGQTVKPMNAVLKQYEIYFGGN